ncbi:MAG TPA: D-ribose ABC transporter substrate-binding protein [Spirochaetia bacterium]|nr:D-ribose ABC transporter substrate-binding protein [Spirochaetia bacterium]
MKRGRFTLTLALAVSLAFLLAGQAFANGQKEKSSSSTSSTSGSKLMAIIVPSLSNPFFVAEEKFAKAEAEKLGYQTMVASHNDDANTQQQLIDTAIARHASAIILDNAGADVSIAPIKKATDAGIPVFLIDREINAKGIAKAQIVSNNFQGAQLEATQFAKLMNYKGTFVELTGLPSDTNAHVREQGVGSILSKFPDMKMVAIQTADWDQTKAFNVTQTLLQAHPNIEGLVADNDTMAMGAEAALLAAHKPNVIVIGFDGSPDVVNSMKKGEIKADVLQPIAVFSTLAVEEANQYLTTGSTGKPEKQELNCILITPENMNQYQDWSMSSGS